MEVKSRHQSQQYGNKFKLWALMIAIKNRVCVPDQMAGVRLW